MDRSFSKLPIRQNMNVMDFSKAAYTAVNELFARHIVF